MTGPLRPVPASSVEALPMEMIWRNRIPAATLSVVAGKPGLGKSTLATAIASELSQTGTVIISNLEDDPNAVIRPRLDVAGADLSRVLILKAEEVPNLPRGIAQFEELVRDVQPLALILDPIAAHFPSERAVHNRATLGRFIFLARDTGCAIIAIHHSLKTSTDRTALGAIGGPSGGLAGSARAVYLYGYDPSDQDCRALACVKINGVDRPPTLLIEHETVEFKSAGRLLEAGLLRFGDESNDEAEAVMHPGAKRQHRDEECAEWLTLFLSADPDFKRTTRDVQTFGRSAGFGWQTLIRAGVPSRRSEVQPDGRGDRRGWPRRESHPRYPGLARRESTAVADVGPVLGVAARQRPVSCLRCAGGADERTGSMGGCEAWTSDLRKRP